MKWDRPATGPNADHGTIEFIDEMPASPVAHVCSEIHMVEIELAGIHGKSGYPGSTNGQADLLKLVRGRST